MNCFDKRKITYDEFWVAIRSAPCQALSGRARPSEGEASYRYDCQLAELIRKPVYPVWYVNRARTDLRNYSHTEACAIRIEELAALDQIVCPKLDQWSRSHEGPIVEASVIILHCKSCNRRVLIDGVHRVLWLLRQRALAAPIHITELSGSQWPVGTPDLNVVCKCIRQGGTAPRQRRPSGCH